MSVDKVRCAVCSEQDEMCRVLFWQDELEQHSVKRAYDPSISLQLEDDFCNSSVKVRPSPTIAANNYSYVVSNN